MNILVFASKLVGCKCVEFLLKEHMNDNYTFVITEKNDEKLKALLVNSGQNFYEIDNFNDHLNNDESFDWILNLWGGLILESRLLSKAKNNLNIHPSMLPHARGKDPIVWTIQNNFPAGTTLHEMTSKIDAGDIFYQQELAYCMPIKGLELYDQILKHSVNVFKNNWSSIKNNPKKLKIDYEKHQLFLRKHLINNQTKDFSDETINKTLLWLLSHDFTKKEDQKKGKYGAQVIINNKVYIATLSLEEKN